MTDWLDDTLEDIDSREDDRWREYDWQVHCVKRISKLSPEIWRNLNLTIQTYVERINKHYREKPTRQLSIRTPDNPNNVTFSVATQCCPQISLIVSFEREAQLIGYKYIERLSRQSSETDLSDDRLYLSFQVDDKDNVSLVHEGNPKTLDEVSQMLLVPLIDRKY